MASVHRKENAKLAVLPLKMAGKEQEKELGDDSESENHLYA
jgi:hypothetical protein